jgi:hypothetical protein
LFFELQLKVAHYAVFTVCVAAFVDVALDDVEALEWQRW